MFRDPRICIEGKQRYRTVFWSLRFHGRIFFRHLYLEVRRIWQPSDGVINMRWTVHGVPRVPWEAEGRFDGISQYKLDSGACAAPARVHEAARVRTPSLFPRHPLAPQMASSTSTASTTSSCETRRWPSPYPCSRTSSRPRPSPWGRPARSS